MIRPLADAGRLPVLSRWMRDGEAGPLESTLPAGPVPAWSSFWTGLGPGRHGRFDATQKVPGQYRVQLTDATDRVGASLFARVSRAGGRVLALGVPAAFPPEELDGLLVCGDGRTGDDVAPASHPSLYREIADRVGPWPQAEASDEDWRERGADALLRRIERKTAFALEALRVLRATGRGPDLLTVVFSESETAARHFWRDHDPGSPGHDPDADASRRGALAAVYERLDGACGQLRRAFDQRAPCVVVSAYGSGGAARRVVHLNRRLEETGLLRRSQTGRGPIARRARAAVLRRLRPPAARSESGLRFGGIDWGETVAFSEEADTQPGVWINLRGREARGCVAASDYERVCDDVVRALEDWKLPAEGGGAGGEPVVARVRRREEVYRGPFLGRAPDLVVELGSEAGYALPLRATPWAEEPPPVRWLEDRELAAGGASGLRRPRGVWIASGDGDWPGAPPLAHHLVNAAPLLLQTLGLPPVEDLDG